MGVNQSGREADVLEPCGFPLDARVCRGPRAWHGRLGRGRTSVITGWCPIVESTVPLPCFLQSAIIRQC